jgi:transposase
VIEVAARLGINKHSLYEWVKQAKSRAEGVRPVASGSAETSDSKEVRRLRAELKRVTEERDIIKKAAAYFAKG